MPSQTAAPSPVIRRHRVVAPEVRALEDEISVHFGDPAGLLALPRSYGQIYGLLFAVGQPLSFTDIVEQLGLSKASVSMGLHALREAGAVHRAEGADWRREHFVAETDLRTLIAGFLSKSIEPELKKGLTRIERMRSRHRGLLTARNGDGRALLERLDRLHRWHRKGGAVLPLIAKLLG